MSKNKQIQQLRDTVSDLNAKIANLKLEIEKPHRLRRKISILTPDGSFEVYGTHWVGTYYNSPFISASTPNLGICDESELVATFKEWGFVGFADDIQIKAK
jgi:hypothetical protein